MNVQKVLACVLAALLAPAVCAADPARFDLIGPKIDVRITRGATSLPIAEVPSLQPGDKIWIKADLPHTQSNHLLIVVAFLRGTTNLPPDNWFTEIDTWDKKTIEGTTVVVPAGAEEALMFVAPQTGGDFKTLRSAVKGRPGLFIRADADLNEASFEQQRIERYLAAMKTVPLDDPKAIQERSAKLAATLALKPNADCFKQPVDQQIICLTQASAPVLLDDGHGAGIAEALSSGPSSDFINAASYTQPAGGGLYSAYVGAIVDAVHIVSMLRTAAFQYIPGLSFPNDATLNLRLNTPPSFHKPDSVIVIGLPAIQKAILPPLHPPDPSQVACLLQPSMVLRLQGAPLVFSTSFAHDLVLHLNRTGGVTDLPLTANAAEGGLTVTKEKQREPLRPNAPLKPAPTAAKTEAKIGSASDLTITGTIRGYWGFDAFEGPTLTVQQIDGKGWKIVGDTQLLAGQDNHLTLTGQGTGCIQHIALSSDKAKDVNVTFKPSPDPSPEKDKKDTLALDVPLKTVQPGGYALAIQQYGSPDRDKVSLTAYTAGITLGELKIHTGDNLAVLSGEGLKNVASVEIDKQTFTPEADTGNASNDEILHLESRSGVSPADGSEAIVKLKDGRTMNAKISTSAARPSLKLVYVNAAPAQQPGTLAVILTNKDDIPLNGTLTFVVQTKDAFPRDQSIEVATANNAVHTRVSLSDNSLVLEDDHTAVAHLDPLKAFGQSAFGRLAIRPIAADGTTGDWVGLGTLVRTPKITSIQCTSIQGSAPAASSCTLNGDGLFLAQSFSAGKDFAKPTEVPTGFAESTFNVPTPTDGLTLYLKLRDDPTSTATVTLPTPLHNPSEPATPATRAAAPTPPASASAPARSTTAAPSNPQ
jgi:hypothetical protein